MTSTLLVLVLLTACGEAETAVPSPPLPTDDTVSTSVPGPGQARSSTGPFFVDAASFRIAESSPIQVFVDVSGNQPTPCDEATWTVERVAGTVQIELYTVADPAATCIAALEPVELVIPLGAFESGTWIVLLNGEELGSFDA